MEQVSLHNYLTPTKLLFRRKHKSANKIPNPTLCNKLKINFPFLSVRSDRKNRENYQERSWTQRGMKCKTEEILKSTPQQIKKTKRDQEKDIVWDVVVDEKTSGARDRMNQFLNENPQGMLARFQYQAQKKQSQKIKRQLHNLEQIQSKLFNRIQSINHEQGCRTQVKHTRHNRLISNDFLPSLKQGQKQMRNKKQKEKIIICFDGMITFSAAGGKEWNGVAAFKTEHEMQNRRS